MDSIIFHVRKARDVIFNAFEEARVLDDNYVGNEHLLLALLRNENLPACQALRQMGILPDDIRSEIKRQGDRSMRINLNIQMTKAAIRTIDAAIEEAKLLDHKELTDEHILLGILREHDLLGAKVLYKLGAELNAARNIIRSNSASL